MIHKFGPTEVLTDVHAGVWPVLALQDSKEPAADSPPSFAQIFEAHASLVWRAASRLGVPPADLPDVCQEVFFAIHRMLPNFEGRSSLTSWLYGICWRTVSHYRRKALRRREELTPELPDNPVPSHQLEDVELRRFRGELDRVLFRLPREQREIFELYELEELSVPEAAAIVGCPVQTAYSRLRVAREAVVAAFSRENGGSR